MLETDVEFDLGQRLLEFLEALTCISISRFLLVNNLDPDKPGQG